VLYQQPIINSHKQPPISFAEEMCKKAAKFEKRNDKEIEQILFNFSLYNPRINHQSKAT
jgi:hypothetical protein